MNKALIALGSNIGDSINILNSVIADLKADSELSVIKVSSLYKTKAKLYEDQPDFINAAISLTTDLDPVSLLDKLFFYENKYKRKRIIRWGPRTLDLDLIDYENTTLDTEKLTIPHKGMHERAFVLVPLHEIEPNYLVIKHQLTIAQLYEKLPKKDLDEVMKI